MSQRGQLPSLAWAERNADRLARVRLPEKIKCKECKRKKGAHEFSNRQLDEARARIVNTNADMHGASEGGWITCTICSATQLSELQCIICDKFKSLDQFSRQQRKKPDEAKCSMCTLGALTSKGGKGGKGEAKKEPSEDDSSSDEDGNIEQGAGVEIGDVLHGSDDENSHASGVEFSDSFSRAVGAVWVTQPRHGGMAFATRSTNVARSFDPSKYGTPTESISGAGRISTPLQPDKYQSTGTASSAATSGKWGKPKNPNVPIAMDDYDITNDWGIEKDAGPVVDPDDLP